jgi:hypothetical protein
LQDGTSLFFHRPAFPGQPASFLSESDGQDLQRNGVYPIGVEELHDCLLAVPAAARVKAIATPSSLPESFAEELRGSGALARWSEVARITKTSQKWLFLAAVSVFGPCLSKRSLLAFFFPYLFRATVAPARRHQPGGLAVAPFILSFYQFF